MLGSVLGKPPAADKYSIRVEAFMAQPDAARLHQIAEDVARGQFDIPIALTMKLSEIQEAQRIAERWRGKGQDRHCSLEGFLGLSLPSTPSRSIRQT